MLILSGVLTLFLFLFKIRRLRTLSFGDLEAIGRVDDDVVKVRPPTQNVGGSSSGPTVSSTTLATTAAGSSIGVGVVVVGTTPTRQQTDKRREPEAKGRRYVKNILKRPSTAHPEPAKNLKGSAAKGVVVNLTVEHFESCIRVGKYGQDLFIKWNYEAADREKGKFLEPKIYG